MEQNPSHRSSANAASNAGATASQKEASSDPDEEEKLITPNKSGKVKKSNSTSTEPKTPYVPPTYGLARRLTLQDLKTDQYNGCVGTVVGLPEEGDEESRYRILVDGHGDIPLRIREKNLLPLLKKGTRVKVVNLDSAVQFNGRVGEIVALPQPGKDTRYDVKLDNEEKPIAVRAQNIEIYRPIKKIYNKVKGAVKTRVDRVSEWRRSKLYPDE